MSKKKKYNKGGLLRGPSHKQGGIPAYVPGQPPIELEGEEYVIQKNSVNQDTEAVLEYINENGRLPYKYGGKIVKIDARKRRK